MTTPADLVRRFDELAALQPGWFNGDGVAFDPAGLRWLRDLCSALPDAARQGLHVFPAPDGLVLLEWERGDWAPSLEVDLAKRSGQWHAVNVATGEEQAAIVDLRSTRVWLQLSDQLQAMPGYQR